MFVQAVVSVWESVRTFVSDLWGIFRAHPGLMLAITVFAVLIAWSANGSQERTCRDIRGIFYGEDYGPLMTWEQSVDLAQRYPSLLKALNRCNIDLSAIMS